MKKVSVAIIGAGPYGLSLAAHLAGQAIDHRIFGRPMQFWSRIAETGGDRYLKSYCFGTNISAPMPGYSFADYNGPRGLETFEPCSMQNFAAYGQWFQQNVVPWVEDIDVARLDRQAGGFGLSLADGSRCEAERVVIATGLSGFAYVPDLLATLPTPLVVHTSDVSSFAAFKGRDIAVVGAGQSALEAAALLFEAGARPQLLVREDEIFWQTRVSRERSLWRRMRSPIAGLGTGPKAWTLTHFPGAMHSLPDTWRTRFTRNHLPPEGAWWLRSRVEDKFPIHCSINVVQALEADGRVALTLRDTSKNNLERRLVVDHVVAGTGYDIDVDRLSFIEDEMRASITRLKRYPRLDASFESSVPGLHFIGPASAMSFGPLFRFVVGADYSAHVLSGRIAPKASLAA
ncbi:oxidoreductase/NAD(FAD)-dependent dehydrogenases [Bradyrhizobium oligotrophicum S58]|uniref:Oxidoreductase/NAD(FAD)-dependent dehydrogenases n=1 Tax=Bradyrhizobium oligotrophicum S58 TaxID=1245469 RepID=M4Z700_9BRAD|nr:NAD(P)-binding domain-containing protein [Bradyrhizobium oligotrophicum]BAM88861.1 oxidoreductase/NAD(FAD)-dependent dehydrogenases [Bradyrhizobium oligotrophicum S58]